MAPSNINLRRKPVGLPTLLYFLGFLSIAVLAVLYEASTPEAAYTTFGAQGELVFGVYFSVFFGLASTLVYWISLRASFRGCFAAGKNVMSGAAGGLTVLVMGILTHPLSHPLAAVATVVLAPWVLARVLSSCGSTKRGVRKTLLQVERGVD